MRSQFQRYRFAFLTVLVTTVIRFALIPIIGYRYWLIFLISILISGRYAGFGPSLFALILGAVSGSALHFTAPDEHFDLHFLLAMLWYLVVGSIVAFMCESENKVPPGRAKGDHATQSHGSHLARKPAAVVPGD